ncbi:MAG: hypothetical protein ACFFCW_44070 [Candidatus Hodarchaeota archaeon]
MQPHRIVPTREKQVRGLKIPVHEKEEEDIKRFGQNVCPPINACKKEILKRPFSSLEDSIMNAGAHTRCAASSEWSPMLADINSIEGSRI